MKVAGWAGALAVGAVAAALLGVSLLAASETTRRAVIPRDAWLVVTKADAKAWLSAPVPRTFAKIVRAPCERPQRVTASARITWSLTADDDAARSALTRRARCLHRHGYLSEADLDTVTRVKPTTIRHGASRVVPLSLQLSPSPWSLSGRSALLALELLGAVLFVRFLRRPPRPPAG